ncbi:hypothetical protein [Thiomicrorhabdus sp. Kp2]|uniref:hypothetical protein n=1 Tax=Thiomicrorhabdus sp. Kp2 TaxID=1123518 RepID=UPI00041A1E3F|nr:hypothetical protein [Thiomicrorhabdus sp. Kp2]
MDWFKTALWQPIKNHIAISMMLFGISLIALGVIVTYEKLDWLSKLLLHSGSAALGGGVFAVILKSAQFTEIFQKHIATVFYDPLKIDDEMLLEHRWMVLSESLLRGTLPISYESASERIYKQFFNKERDYHFENYRAVFDIEVDDDGNMTIHQLTKTNLIISPHAEDPILVQDFSLSQAESASIGHLYINGSDTDASGKPLTEYYEQSCDDTDETFFKLKLPLKNCLKSGSNHQDACLEFERKVITRQKIDSEPYMFVNISRYIKGARIRARVSSGFDVKFNHSHIGRQEEKSGKIDSENFKRWTLAEKDELILPGQAYIIFAVPASEA